MLVEPEPSFSLATKSGNEILHAAVGGAVVLSQDHEYTSRRKKTVGEVLALPTSLRPGEQLRDAVLRATEENGFSRTGPVLGLGQLGSRTQLSAIKGPYDVPEVMKLVDVLGVRRDSPQLHELLANQDAHSRRFVSFFGHRLARSNLLSCRRVSPRALRLDGYQRALWSVRWFKHDIETLECLVDSCPVCRVRLGWEITKGVSYCQKCSSPKTDLRDFPQPLIQVEDERPLRFVSEILDPLVSEYDFRGRWPSVYSGCSRADLFQLAVEIAMECQRFDNNRCGPVESIAPRNLERAGKALLDWPCGLLELAQTGSLRGDLGMLSYLASNETLSRCARNDIRSLGDLTLRRKGLSVPNTDAPVAALPVRRNARTALFSLVREPDRHCSELERIVCVARDITSVRETAVALGVSVPDALDLYRAGFLPKLQRELSKLGVFASQDLGEELSEWIRRNAVCSSHSSGMRLADLRFTFDAEHRASLSDVFRALIDGKITVYRGPPSGRGLIYDLLCNDFRRIRAVMSRSEVASEFREVPLLTQEVALTIVKSRPLVKALDTMFGWEGRFTLGRLAEIRQSYAFSFELESLLAIAGRSSLNIFTALNRGGVTSLRSRKLTLWERQPALTCLELA